MTLQDIFLKAIHEKRIVIIEVNSFEKGVIQRKCVPYDFGPSRKFRDGFNRYHFYDLNSPEGSHNLSILPEQLLNIQITDEKFHPRDYVNWKPNWYVKRDWGECS
ncbi:hypothetical protein [Methanoregula sp.]|uniref:hypothetical protein n=1 Tax=Methanoregula sp. TaxID=2052170 RepID=UPI002C6EE4EE|nr:hypothetical protein [Methanoregula sp.]HVP97629.1 hypothetical protein [Methanoregula sp.]